MAKTYSVAIQKSNGDWITNWGQYWSPDDIDWEEVKRWCEEQGHIAYGYMHGHNSRNLVSSRVRTVLHRFDET